MNICHTCDSPAVTLPNLCVVEKLCEAMLESPYKMKYKLFLEWVTIYLGQINVLHVQ